MQAKSLGVLSVVIVAGLPGCSYLMGDDGMFRDREADYITAPSIDPITIPDDLDSYTLDQLYVIPPAPQDRAFFVRAPAPAAIDTSIREGVVVQRFGDRRWIVIGAEPAQVWPRLQDFWTNSQIPLESENPIAATMVTEWIGNEGEQDKYHVRVEPGLHSGNSEVYVVHVNEESVTDMTAPVDWPDESVVLQREHDMLERISVYLADRTDLYRASSVSLLAGSIEAASKARLERSARGTVLHMDIDYDRAWSQIQQSLGNTDAQILSSDRSAGTFEVAYNGEIDEDDRPGFFSRLFGFGDDEIDAKTFSIVLTANDADTAVTVTASMQEGAAEPQLQDELVRSIHSNLI
ncbi:MAG: outer membrane protein assembly factor BamC [Pseudohongiellaceae bacterium]|nr:outer membrane protein assembly factor BamC [Pseudohongiellaceae bacterium]